MSRMCSCSCARRRQVIAATVKPPQPSRPLLAIPVPRRGAGFQPAGRRASCPATIAESHASEVVRSGARGEETFPLTRDPGAGRRSRPDPFRRSPFPRRGAGFQPAGRRASCPATIAESHASELPAWKTGSRPAGCRHPHSPSSADENLCVPIPPYRAQRASFPRLPQRLVHACRRRACRRRTARRRTCRATAIRSEQSGSAVRPLRPERQR